MESISKADFDQKFKIDFTKPIWLETDNHYILIKNSTSKHKFLVTASNCSKAAGNSKYKTPEEIAKHTLGISKFIYNDFQLNNMTNGLNNESLVRDFYNQKHNKKVEPGKLTVPKFNTNFCCITDGDVDQDGILEIKTMNKTKQSLVDYIEDKSTNPEVNIKHYMLVDYYDQIQFSLGILDKKWCDYLVLFCDTGDIFEERINFDPEYFQELVIKLENYIENVVKPMIK